MRNTRHDIPNLSNRARALLLLTIEKIEQTGLYNQDALAFRFVQPHTCKLEESPLCIVGWMNAIASSLGLDTNGLTEEQESKLYWYREWPKKFRVVPHGTEDVPISAGIARIKCFLKSGGTR